MQLNIWDVKISKVELENVSFQHVNDHWLLNELPVASIMDPWGLTQPKKWKSENTVTIKCIYSVHFIVGFVLQWIHGDSVWVSE